MKFRFSRFALGIVFLVVVFGHSPIFGQLERIEKKVPNNIPLKVEFNHQESSDWAHDLEITVTNTGEKPIYFLYLNLFLDGVKSPEGIKMTFPLLFGSQRMYSAHTAPGPDDEAILPQKSITLKIEPNFAKGWNNGVADGLWPNRVNTTMEIGWIYFGDGSGFGAKGVPFQKKTDRARLIFVSCELPINCKNFAGDNLPIAYFAKRSGF